jgi:cephalosporin hydroxylase
MDTFFYKVSNGLKSIFSSRAHIEKQRKDRARKLKQDAKEKKKFAKRTEDGNPVFDSRYKEMYGRTVADWMNYHQDKIIFDKVKWMGHKSVHNVLDLWIYQEIFFERRPEVIVEIGSLTGGTTLFLANMCDLLNHGQIVTIDVAHEATFPVHPRITKLLGRSDDPDILKKVSEIIGHKTAMIIHDGDHSKDPVLTDLKNYSKFVKKGQYFIVCDGIIDIFARGTRLGKRREGPVPAIHEFLKDHPEFRIDFERERYEITYNQYGYLERI